MKWYSLIFILFLFSSATCNKPSGTTCFKGRLEIKGICMNYVIKVLEGNTANLNIARAWTDETDGRTHENVFALASKCDFPDMAEGAEFYFTIVDKSREDCAVCLAIRPLPDARNRISVNQTPCR